MTEGSAGFIIDTPEGIQAYRMIAIVHGLRMEIHMTENGWPPTACQTRGMALRGAKQVLKVQKGERLTRKAALGRMESYCQEHGISLTPQRG